jgi:hypothetical protein
MATIANAANASTTRIGAHLGQLKIILGFIGSLNESSNVIRWRISAVLGQDGYADVGTSET